MIKPSSTNSQLVPEVSRAIQCKHCRKTFTIGLADGGKDIHFLNMISWDCPACRRHNLTPFLNTSTS